MDKWKVDVDTLCKRFGAEPLIIEGDYEHVRKMCIASPQKLAGEEQAAIARCVPVDIVCEFKVVPMNWRDLLYKVCAKFNVEPTISKRDPTTEAIKEIQFNCPKELSADERTVIIDPVPQGIEMKFEVAPKQSTVGRLNTALLMMGTKVEQVNYDPANRILEVAGRGLVINRDGEEMNLGEILTVLPPDVWDHLSYCLKADGAIDSCKVSCDGHDFIMDVKNTKKPEHDINIENASQQFNPGLSPDIVGQQTAPSVLPSKPKVAGKGPERDICPTKDEITNLTIDLENATSIDDVLRLMGADPTQK